MGGKELEYVTEAFEQNWIAPVGPGIEAFEHDLELFLGGQVHVAAMNSGTAAMHLALILAGVGSGDVVLCQSLTFCATANPILYQGARPVFVDSENESWNIDPNLLKQAIEEETKKGRKPKAVIAVHLYGMPAQWDEIANLCKAHHIPLIEDAAEALGATYKDRPCGSLGDYAILSFNGNKIISCGGGGALVCQNQEDKAKAIYLASQAKSVAAHYEHEALGYNYRLSNVLACIGRGQMEVLPERIRQKREVNTNYRKLLENTDVIFLNERSDTFSNYWLTTILCPTYELRERIRLAMAQENIECRPIWKPMHLQSLYRDAGQYVQGCSQNLFERGLCLPSGTAMTTSHWERIEAVLRALL
ncbi:unnamed protein product [Cyprideis torosa]|uniref:Uncharacterized protein n=1 Tax=Cyprideis torosa TaxID=163714 RepID=A0A7R8WUE3_9CRUS|nr:unnamed protein product [Cyprideis torosa]CAG0906692.1 unnamed protein product [Cyprideis torosa]